MKIAFIGHKNLPIDATLKTKLYTWIETAITQENADTFLFCNESEFNDLCYEAVSKLKKKYPHITRIYIRAEDEFINDSYRDYLLSLYDDTLFPQRIRRADNKSAERNQALIKMCNKLAVYRKPDCDAKKDPDDMTLAVKYAKKLRKPICNLFDAADESA